MAISNSTGSITGTGTDVYHQNTMNCILDNNWISTDRLVIKFYSSDVSGTTSEYDFQFGGNSPMRAELPVPVSVIPSTTASGILVDTSGFNNFLDASCSNVQCALDLLDDHVHYANDISDFDIEVSNNTDVNANTSSRHSAVTVTDSSEIDFTLTDQEITAEIKLNSINKIKLSTAVNNSLDLADSAVQNVDLSTLSGTLQTQIDDLKFLSITTPDLTGNYYEVASDDYTVLINDDDVQVTSTVVVAVPPASLNLGRIINIKKIGSSQIVQIVGDGGETIDGSGTIDIVGQYNNVTIQSDGTAWFII